MKKFIFSCAAASLFSVATMPVAYAVEKAEIDLFASVPGSTFYVRAVNPSDISGVQTMGYNLLDEELESLTYRFTFKKPASQKITAQLATTADLFDGTNTIPLAVTFNGVPVTTTQTDVVAEAVDAASVAKLANLVISPTLTAGTYVPGDYTGEVSILFEEVTP
ncbi:CS1 type fimbrial major subunit [Vibrio astriarenae]